MEGFRHYPAQRSAVLDDIMGAVLPNLPMGKCTQRAFLIGDDEQLRTQMVSALMLQLVQVSLRSSLSQQQCTSLFGVLQAILQGQGIRMMLGADASLQDGLHAASTHLSATACCS